MRWYIVFYGSYSGEPYYWTNEERWTPVLKRGKSFPTQLGAQHELNHLPTAAWPYNIAKVEAK